MRNMPRSIVVIGAGAVGAMTAIACLHAGFAVTVVDPAEPGGEHAASFGNAGWLSSHSVLPTSEPGLWRKLPRYLLDPSGPLALRPGHALRAAPWLLRYLAAGWTPARVERTARALRPLLADAPRLHAEVAGEAGVAHLVEQNGVLHLYRSRAAFGNGGLAWAIRRKLGITWDELEGSALRAVEPDLSPDYGFALRVGEAGCCRDPGAYVGALAAHARARGAEFINATATGFVIENQHLSAVMTDRGPLPCDGAVIAAGAHAKPLAQAAGDTVPLESERGYHVEIVGELPGLHSSAMVAEHKMVVTRTQRGLRAAGQVEIAALEAAPDWRRAGILKEHLLRVIPKLQERTLAAADVRVWMGHRPTICDGKPCLGHSSRSRDIVFAFGHGHIGLAAAARTGRVVAQLLAEQEPEIPIAAFAPQRFSIRRWEPQ